MGNVLTTRTPGPEPACSAGGWFPTGSQFPLPRATGSARWIADPRAAAPGWAKTQLPVGARFTKLLPSS